MIAPQRTRGAGVYGSGNTAGRKGKRLVSGVGDGHGSRSLEQLEADLREKASFASG
jgi:hypothetical protein